jgi:hypothetical protein
MAWSWEIIDGNHAAIDEGSVETEVAAGLYADDGVIDSTDPVCMQSGLDYLVELFEQAGLLSHTSKTKVMVCTPNPLKGNVSNQTYKRWISGEGPTYISRQKGEYSVLFVKRRWQKGIYPIT